MAIQLDGTTGISTTGNIIADGSLVVGSFIPTSISTTGNVTGGNINTAGALSVGGNAIVTGDLTVVGNASLSGNIVGDKITNGTTSVEIQTPNGNANITIGGTSNVAVFSTTGAYITGVISANGNITGGNLNAAVLSLSSNVISALNSTSNITTTANISGGYILGNGSQLSGIDATSIQNGSSNVRVVGSGSNVTVSVGGTSNVAVFATTGEFVTGLLSVSGNIVGANIDTSGLIFATGNIGSSSNINATGNVFGANLLTTGIATVGGNVQTNSNVNAVGLSLSGNVLSAINSASNITTSANITSGNVNTNKVVGTSLTLVSTGDLVFSATGNINANNEYINNVPQPQQDGDAVNKLYVDGLVTTGFAFHTPVFAATSTTLATATSGTITYTQPNGVANGVGAVLTTTGSFNLIDTANIQTVGTRVLVKDQTNAVQNGVYTWANATAIVRSTDTDEYGPDSTTQLSINDYFFVQSGNVNAGSAFVVSAPAGTITFGTSNITFAQFSSSQTYTANTSAGISLNGTVINALVDNVTTAFSSGNIVVKASANLTTPNIGAATGTSLSTTGNITGGNLSGTNIVGTLTTASQTNITSVGTLGSLTVTANTTSGNLLTGGLISATGNITGGNANIGGNLNVTSSLNVDGGVYGNVTTTPFAAVFGSGAGPNPYSIMQVRSNDGASGIGMQAYTGQGVLYANTAITFALGTIRDKDVPSSLVTKAYIDSTGLNVTGVVSASGNVTGSNVLTGGLISATGNISGNYFLGNGSQLTGIDATSIQNGTSNVRVVSSGGNVTVSVGGTSNVAVFATTGEFVTGLLSVTGNITGGNLSGTNIVGTLTTASQTNITAVGTLGSLNVTGNVTGGNLNAAGLSLSSNVVSALVSAANITTTANISGGFILGNGSALTGITASVSKISNGTSEANIGTSAGNANITIAGTSNVAVFTTTGLNITGIVSATGNITGGNILGGANVNATTHTGATVSVTGNITGGNVTVQELFYNSTTVDSSFTIPAGFNALVAGPITVQNGVVGTVSNGTTWQIVG